jgi:hypothetical protein
MMSARRMMAFLADDRAFPFQFMSVLLPLMPPNPQRPWFNNVGLIFVVRARGQTIRPASDDQTEKNMDLVDSALGDDYELDANSGDHVYVQRFERLDKRSSPSLLHNWNYPLFDT